MIYREIFDAALKAICVEATPEAADDYLERAPYLLGVFLNQCAPIDQRYRKVNQLPAVTHQTQWVMVNLESDFPLCDIFAPAAIYYLSAMLVIDESEELSDKFFSLYTDAIATIQAELACAQEKIVDRYGFMK